MVLVITAFALVITAASAVPETPSVAPDTSTVVAEAEIPQKTLRIWMQAGFWLRLNDRFSHSDSGGDMPMLTFEVTGFRWDGRSTTWGLGARGAGDDLGWRVGPKAFVRFPLGSGGKTYYQVAGAYYLVGWGDLESPPGWNLEAEVAPISVISLALGYELLKYQYWGYGYGSEWSTETATSTYVGIKINQWAGLVVTAALFAAAGLVAASM